MPLRDTATHTMVRVSHLTRQRINTMRDERGYLSVDEMINAALDALPGQAIRLELAALEKRVAELDGGEQGVSYECHVCRKLFARDKILPPMGAPNPMNEPWTCRDCYRQWIAAHMNALLEDHLEGHDEA